MNFKWGLPKNILKHQNILDDMVGMPMMYDGKPIGTILSVNIAEGSAVVNIDKEAAPMFFVGDPDASECTIKMENRILSFEF